MNKRLFGNQTRAWLEEKLAIANCQLEKSLGRCSELEEQVKRLKTEDNNRQETMEKMLFDWEKQEAVLKGRIVGMERAIVLSTQTTDVESFIESDG